MFGTSRRVLLAALLATFCGASALAAPARDRSMLLESKAAVRRALRYLAGRQQENGSWQDHPAITALVVTGMLGSGEKDFGVDSEVVARALAYVRSHAQQDGGIYDDYYASYSTSVCAVALARAARPEDEELISRARTFLLDLQADESEGFGPDDPAYGGWGYERNAPESGGGMHRPDLSNTQFALEAIKNLEALLEEEAADADSAAAGEMERTQLAYEKALRFLERCQNRQASNDQPWAGDDGGFVYSPTESKAGESPEGGLRSYAGMTYAGLKSMIYAKLTKDDPRVKAAWEWACRHWSVTENPGLGQQGLYYYYLTMARALNVYGVEEVPDASGVAHDWRRELVGQLLAVQEPDGSWVNRNSRWMESIPDLVTAFAVLAIEDATSDW